MFKYQNSRKIVSFTTWSCNDYFKKRWNKIFCHRSSVPHVKIISRYRVLQCQKYSISTQCLILAFPTVNLCVLSWEGVLVKPSGKKFPKNLTSSKQLSSWDNLILKHLTIYDGVHFPPGFKYVCLLRRRIYKMCSIWLHY